MKEYETKKDLLTSKLKEQGKKKKYIPKRVKNTKDQLETVINKIKNIFSLEEAVFLRSEILPDITAVLNIICVCPASGAVVNRGFSLMNLIVNDLQSSMNIKTLDAAMHIHFYGIDFTDERLIKLLTYAREGEI